MPSRIRLIGATLLAGFVSGVPLGFVTTAAFAQAQPDPNAKADPDMKRVIAAQAALGAKPLHTLTVAQARSNPSPAAAATKVLADMGKPTTPPPGITVQDLKYPTAGGTQLARVYKPASAKGPLPVIAYYHGGGWVIADVATYDAGARALAREANAIVVSSEYRHAPEHKFPAAHDDAVAAYKWIVANAAKWGGDPQRIAVAGESAGGNLAANVAIAARDQKLQRPVHMTLVYPVAGANMNTPSYVSEANAKPLSKAGMQWFVKHVFPTMAQTKDARLDLIGAGNLKGLPSATIINAEIDPLRSDGELLAGKLRAAGVPVVQQTYKGTAHEFFGMDAVVADAKAAQALAGRELKKAFSAKR